MLSESQLSEKNKWKEKGDTAGPDDRYRLNVTIAQLTKEEAIKLRAKIIPVLYDVLPGEFFDEEDLLDHSILNENTGRYTHTLEDKY